jgi:hypothetical protein
MSGPSKSPEPRPSVGFAADTKAPAEPARGQHLSIMGSDLGAFDETLADERLFRLRTGTAVIPAAPAVDFEALMARYNATRRVDVAATARAPYPPRFAPIFEAIRAATGPDAPARSSSWAGGSSAGPSSSSSSSSSSSTMAPAGSPSPSAATAADTGIDSYVAHAHVSKPGKDREWDLVVTRRGYYKVDPGNPEKFDRRELRNLAEVEPLGPRGIRLHQRNAQGAAKAITGIFAGWKKKKELVASTIIQRDFVFATAAQRDDWVTILRRLVRDAWQEIMELGPYMPAPEVYQTHMFLTKLNKKNQPQVRVLCVSDRRVLNVEPRGVELAAVKWAIPIAALQSIDCQASDGLAFTLYMDTKSADVSKQNMKPAVAFIANDPDHRRFVREELCRLYSMATGKELKVYE